MQKIYVPKKLVGLFCVLLFFSIVSCKKDLSTKDQSASEKNQIENEKAPRVMASFPSKYKEEVANLIKQRKPYSDFLKIPGWTELDPAKMNARTQSKASRNSGLSAERDDDDDYSNSFESASQYSSGYTDFTNDLSYYPGVCSECETQLYSNVEDMGFILPGDQYYFWGYKAPKPRVKQVPLQAEFTKRNVSALVNLPFIYTVGGDYYFGVKYTYSNIASYPALFHIAGVSVGEIDESMMHVYFILDRYGNGTFIGEGVKETRTVIVTSDGHLQISAEVNLEYFKAGAQWSTGVTIQTAYHTPTDYTCEGSITLAQYGYSYDPSYSGVLSAYSVGIQRDF